MNICFIMYPWEAVTADTDSTLRLIHESATRGHRVAITTPNNLTVRESIPQAFCKVLNKDQKITKNIPSFHKQAQFKEQMLPLGGFDIVFMRDNPPVDPITLNFLDSVKDTTLIINSIDGIRKANNKLYTAAFYDPRNEIIPATHVSKNKEYLKRVIKESETDKMIMKPLNGYGGSGVIVIEKSATQNINSLLDFYIDDKAPKTGKSGNYVIIQEYIEGAEEGDVRVIMLNGEPIGAMKRVPGEGDHRSNVHAGGSVKKHSLSPTEKKICKRIGPKLVEDGLYLVGLDIINGKLIEVNVCSPGGIARINKLNRTKLQTKILDFAEDVVETRDVFLTRKQEFRKAVSDA